MDIRIGEQRPPNRRGRRLPAVLAAFLCLVVAGCGRGEPAGPPQTFTITCNSPNGGEIFRETRVLQSDFSISKEGTRVNRPGEKAVASARFSPAVACQAIPNSR